MRSVTLLNMRHETSALYRGVLGLIPSSHHGDAGGLSFLRKSIPQAGHVQV